MTSRLGAIGLGVIVACAACGSEAETAPAAAATTTGAATGGSGSGGEGGGTGTAGTGGTLDIPVGTCADPAPPGAASAPPAPTYSGGTCPMLVPGVNTMPTTGGDRTFILAVPSDLRAGERLPVIFLWHWLGGSADDFYTKGEVQAAVDGQRFLAIVPESKGDTLFKWPFEASASDARVDEELAFFDDLLACAAEQFELNMDCVSSAGVSAGALWTGVLGGARGDRLSSIISLSGGAGGFIEPWGAPAHKMPAIVLWGGPTDQCVVLNFEDASKNLEADLVANGHFVLECVHNCGHAEPPIDPPPGLSRYGGLWKFAFDHPFWLPSGESIYVEQGIDDLPDWCAIGAGNATPKEGACPPGGGC